MTSYIANSTDEQKATLAYLGLESFEDLYSSLSEAVKLQEPLNISRGISELEVRQVIQEMAEKNVVFPTIFRGAGAYRHYLPAIVKAVGTKETLVTAYTPYQPEVSQGILQSIFEYQTMICELTGMDASNASVYDGATACAEALTMCDERNRTTVYVSETLNPEYLAVIKTYCYGANRKLVLIPEKAGYTDLEFLATNLNEESSCVLIQQPNFYGLIEDGEKINQAIKAVGGRFIMCVNPIFTAIGKTPREYGADIAVGDGQPLGLGLNFGGPYLGFMACTSELARKLPGRIVGETKDIEGKRAFVMTMQAREQHIRRERASSNICSNQALCATIAACYLAIMGPRGLTQVSQQCLSKAHYLAKEITKIKGFDLVFKGEFFHEFVTTCPIDAKELMAKLVAYGILGGYVLENEHQNNILWCCTEVISEQEIEKLLKAIKEIVE